MIWQPLLFETVIKGKKLIHHRYVCFTLTTKWQAKRDAVQQADTKFCRRWFYRNLAVAIFYFQCWNVQAICLDIRTLLRWYCARLPIVYVVELTHSYDQVNILWVTCKQHLILSFYGHHWAIRRKNLQSQPQPTSQPRSWAFRGWMIDPSTSECVEWWSRIGQETTLDWRWGRWTWKIGLAKEQSWKLSAPTGNRKSLIFWSDAWLSISFPRYPNPFTTKYQVLYMEHLTRRTPLEALAEQWKLLPGHN